MRPRRFLLALALGLSAGCTPFGADAPSTSTPDGGGDTDAGTASPAQCTTAGTTLADEAFADLPPAGWTEDDPANLVTLDKDAEDVVSMPSSLRAAVLAQPSGGRIGVIQRSFEQSLSGILCITFQARLEVGSQGFGATDQDVVGLFGIELRKTATDTSPTRVGVAVDAKGLRLHVEDGATPAGIAYATDNVTFQRWTLVVDRAARSATFFVGANRIDLPLDLAFVPGAALVTFGVAANGKVPDVIFHADDARVATLP